MNPGLIPWVDMYSFLPDPRGRELRRKNKERLADLEQRTPERHERFKAAARAWQAERDDMAIPVRCLTCGQRTTQPKRGRCPRCAPTRRDGSTRAWRALRVHVLERDGHTCQRCGQPATHAGHRTPKTHGGTDMLANLHALCAHCNLTEGTR